MLILFLIFYLNFNYCEGVKCPVVEVTNSSGTWNTDGVYQMTDISTEEVPDKPVYKKIWPPGEDIRSVNIMYLCMGFTYLK